MRIRSFLAAGALAAGVLGGPPAAATHPPPPPYTCESSMAGAATPADPGGLTPLSVVVVGSAQVVCTRDLLNSTPNQLREAWWGHITIDVVTDQGQFVCGVGPDDPAAVGPVLVMTIATQCTIPFSSPARHRPLVLRVHWATLAQGYYHCCGNRQLPITPAGVGTP